MEQIIKQSETRMCKALFPNTLNANNTLFGGLAMQWMDEVAYITATRLTHQRMFTVKTEQISFLKAVYPYSFIEVIGVIEKIGAATMRVKVEVFVESMYENVPKEKAIEGVFVLAALDNSNKPIRLQVK